MKTNLDQNFRNPDSELAREVRRRREVGFAPSVEELHERTETTVCPPLNHLTPTEQPTIENEIGDVGWLNEDEEICTFLGVGPNSITSVRRWMKKAGISGFDKNPVTGKRRLSLIDARKIKVAKSKKKTI